MDRIILVKVSTFVLLIVGWVASPVFSQENTRIASSVETLSTLLDEFSEEALGDVSEGVETVGSRDCPIEESEVQKIDAALNLSQSDQMQSLNTHAVFGLPKNRLSDLDEQLLIHPEYLVNYDNQLKIPTMVMYRLTSTDIVKRTRVDCFRPDVRIESNDQSVLIDYVEPIFDRGHLVPRADMNRSRVSMLNTFVLSNMMPQQANFNQGIWRTLETLVRVWASLRGDVIVVTGAIFDQDGDELRDADTRAKRVRPRNNVAIPTHFYKVVIHMTDTGFIEPISILLPHTNEDVGKKPAKLARLENSITSIDQIERMTGLDFFPNMPSSQERAVERSVAAALWSN